MAVSPSAGSTSSDEAKEFETVAALSMPFGTTGVDPACFQKPVHIPGTIQQHGAMLVVGPLCDWTVVAASRNATTMLNASSFAGRVIGRSSGSILGLHFAGGTKTFSRQ